MKLLGAELTLQKRQYLKALKYHEGFPVLRELLEQACLYATKDVLEADPEKENYDTIIKARQQRARHIKEFSEVLLNSINANVEVAEREEKSNALKKEHANA